MATRSVQRTTAALRELGITYAIVEHWNDHAGVRQDMLGFIDIVALWPQKGVVAIQACATDYAEHVRKLTGLRRAAVAQWLSVGLCECGAQLTHVELWGWRKVVKKRGSKVKVWRPRVQAFTMEDVSDDFLD